MPDYTTTKKQLNSNFTPGPVVVQEAENPILNMAMGNGNDEELNDDELNDQELIEREMMRRQRRLEELQPAPNPRANAGEQITNNNGIINNNGGANNGV